MRQFISLLLVVTITLSLICLADEYDLPNMTYNELRALTNQINEQIRLNHDATSSEKTMVESTLKTYVEDLYGTDNVSWAWIDYSYTKEWNYFTIATHADITKPDGGKAKYDIAGSIFRKGNEYIPVFIKIGNDVVMDERTKMITDDRVLKMLGLSTEETTETSATDSSDTKPVENVNSSVESSSTEPVIEESVIAAKGSRNADVKAIQAMLIRLGYLSGGADGDFGGKTEKAVIQFQAEHNMEETGIVTQSVFDAIKAAAAEVPEPEVYPSYTAKQIYSGYKANEIAMDSEVKGKIVEVSGTVDEIGKDWLGNPYVRLRADSYGFELLTFNFPKSSMNQLSTLREGNKATIRGKCTGFSIMFVYFDECTLV